MTANVPITYVSVVRARIVRRDRHAVARDHVIVVTRRSAAQACRPTATTIIVIESRHRTHRVVAVTRAMAPPEATGVEVEAAGVEERLAAEEMLRQIIRKMQRKARKRSESMAIAKYC